VTEASARPSDLRPFLDRFVTACQQDDRVGAAFLGGSHGRGEADAYSDVDLCVIAKDEAYEALLGDRAGFVGRLGTPLFLEDFGFASLVFFVLDDGIEGELFFGSEAQLEDLEPGPTIRTLFDPGGILEGVAFAEERADPAEQREVLRQVLTWFWHEVSHFIAAMGRGELWWASGQLESLRGHCVNLVRIEHGAFAGEEPYEKLDRTIDPAALSPIAETFVPIERDALLRAARALVRFYTEKAPGIAEAHEATYPVRLEELMVKRLDDLDDSR
jgi:predicted nucleotidyltransferase